MGENLIKLSLTQIKDFKKADLIILNTCTVTHKASREIRKEIRKIKRVNPKSFLIVTGCWLYKIRISGEKKDKDFLKLINLSLYKKDQKNLTKLVEKHFFKNKQVKSKRKIYQDKYYQSQKAIIKVQDGCNNFCTYCIVPFLRGRSQSRKIKKILKEIRDKQNQGIKEIILTGVDLADFKDGKNDLTYLIKEILNKTKIKKISFGSINLKILNQDFISLYKNMQNNKLSSHFHIPLQSGCDETLERMGRKYKVKDFIKKIKELNQKIPNFTFSTDLILGFPGETEKEFRKTYKIIKNLKKILKNNFIKIHLFRYSKRKGTRATKMENGKVWKNINDAVKKKRVKQLKKITPNF